MLRLFSFLLVLGLGLTWFSLSPAPAHGQADEAKKAALKELIRKAEEEYKLFFRKPKTPIEFWAAIDFELKTGKFDVAALLIEGLVKLQPKEKTDEKLLEIEEVQGMTPFLKLTTVKEWNKNPDLQKEAEANVKELLDRVTMGLEKNLSDPMRINKLIGQLYAPTFEERAYAFKQLKRTKHRAAPYLVDELIKTVGKEEHTKIKKVMLTLDMDIMPPLLEILKAADDKDYQEMDLRFTILELMELRKFEPAIPYLWHMSSSPKYPGLIQKQAKKTLAHLLDMPVAKLPDARMALTALAEKYYKHQVKFSPVKYEPEDVNLIEPYLQMWDWKPGQYLERKAKKMYVKEAEDFFAMRHTKEVLDLDPKYRPAQKLMLTMILDHTFGKSLDQFLLKPMPADLQKLLLSLDSGLLLEVLDQALVERHLAVILPLVQILGERGEIKAALPSISGPSGSLVKALYFPDRRVQLAGVRAFMQLPGDHSPILKARIIEILQKFLQTTTTPRALALHIPEGKEIPLRMALQGAGYEAVLVPDVKQAFLKLHQSAEYDVILIHHSYPTKDLPFLLAQLRADADVGVLPVLLLATDETKDKLQSIGGKYRNVFVVPESLQDDPAILKKAIEELYKQSLAPIWLADVHPFHQDSVLSDLHANKSYHLSPVERKQLSTEAMFWLWKMGKGEIKGYSLQPTQKALLQATQVKDLAEMAVETLGQLPGTDVQQRLAAIVLDPATDKKVRVIAAYQLQKHVFKHSLVLNKNQIEDLRQFYVTTKEPELLAPLGLLVTKFPGGVKKAGLSDFKPMPVK